MNRKTARYLKKKLDQDVYRHIPKINCKSLCASECTVIPCTLGEYEILTRESGKQPDFDLEKFACGFLKDGKCTQYENRPLICRLYGVVEKMTCKHGCKPERYLSEKDVTRLIHRAEDIAGNNNQYVNVTDEQAVKIAEKISKDIQQEK